MGPLKGSIFSEAEHKSVTCSRKANVQVSKSGRGQDTTSAIAATHGMYRRDIDGLRAFSILSVVAFHTFPRALPGGFIGVDVFFVISDF
jgi:hypothetical protein